MTANLVAHLTAAHVRTGGLVVRVPVTTVWTSPTAPRLTDNPALRDLPDLSEWIARLDTPARLDLDGRVVTQALMWEPVVVRSEQGDWSEVDLCLQPGGVGPEVQRGWVLTSHLGAAQVDPQMAFTVISARLALGHRPGGGAPIVLSGGTYAPQSSGVSIPGSRVIVTPDGSELHIGAGCFSLVGPSAAPDSTERLISVASQWLGTHYLWGGLSGFGVDCSGLLHLSARILGLVIPRDAKDQLTRDADRGRPNNFGRGDFLFFEASRTKRIRHVAIALSGSSMLHAPRAGRTVELFDPCADDYGRDLVARSNLQRVTVLK